MPRNARAPGVAWLVLPYGWGSAGSYTGMAAHGRLRRAGAATLCALCPPLGCWLVLGGY